jgi:transposase
MIAAVIERCVAIDIAKKFVKACVMVGPADGEARSEVRQYGTVVGELHRLREWIQQEGCTHAIIESTGSYWKPIYNILEGVVNVTLANPQEVKARKGHKTDAKDARWLAHLLRHGMVTPSFIPPRPQRELRDLTRRRRKILQASTAEKNRVEKTLEDANVKLTSVLSDVFGVSGQLMLEQLLQGEVDVAAIANLAKRKARERIPELIASLEQHQMNDHHRMMIRFSLEHLQFLEKQLLEIDAQILHKIEEAGYQKEWALLQTVPCIGEATAAVILAEVGPDPKPFASEKDLSSWAGVCPGNNSSAGKNKSGRTNRGNRWLKAALTEAAWGVSRKKECHLKTKFQRLAAKSKPKAVIATAHDLLLLVYAVLTSRTPYREEAQILTPLQRDRLIKHHLRRLGKLGVRVRTPSVLALGSKPASCRRRAPDTP